MKATLIQLKESYDRHGNVWKVAEEFGMCGQSVWERLKRNNLLKEKNYYKENENKRIIEIYSQGIDCGDGKTDKLVKELKRDRHSIARQAKKLGLTKRNRKKAEKLVIEMTITKKEWYKNNPHPKGMLGKTHSQEMRDNISIRVKKWHKKASPEMQKMRTQKQLLTKLEIYGTVTPNAGNPKVTWKQGWRKIGQIEKYYRSSWEANYARYLEWQKSQGMIKEWSHEPRLFWFEEIKRGAITYLPDFKVENLDGSHLWIEVKGWMCPRSKTKIKRFRKYYPEEELKVIDAKWFAKNAKTISLLIPDWEFKK